MLRRAWSRFDESFLFDPARWPLRAPLVALLASLGSAALIARRVTFLPRFPGTIPAVDAPMRALVDLLAGLPEPLRPGTFDVAAHYGALGFSAPAVNALWAARLGIWLVETGVWAAYIVGFARRAPPRATARGFMETAFPALVAVFPMAISSAPYSLDRLLAPWPAVDAAAMFLLDAVLLLGGWLHVHALWTLRRAFTITTEARHLVTRGPYARVRHPVYAAHFVVFGAQALLRPSWTTLLLYAAFVAAQAHRARREERKLAAAFPEYAEYARTTGRFWPR